MQWWNRSTPVGAALLAAAVLSGCGTKVPLDQPTPRMTTPLPPPPPAPAPVLAPPPEPLPSATPMPVAPSAEAA